MLEILTVLLFCLWMVGLLSAYAWGGYIHVLLLIAALMLLTRFVRGRRVT
jgi:hypothetical protein